MSDAQVSLRDAVPVYIRIGLLSFGGPAGQIALMQDEIVDRRGWISSASMQRGLNVAMLLPGPEAQQLATWLGWRLHGLAGGMAAGLAFILPGAVLMIALAWIAAAYGETRLLSAVFTGIQPAVLVIVARAFWSLAKRSLKSPLHWSVAAAAFLAIWAAGLPFPLIIAAAALAGVILFPAAETATLSAGRPERGHLLSVLGVSAAILIGVYAFVRVTLGAEPFDGVATLFTTAAFVSFGGAYALLPYVADRAVETYGWLTAAQMLNGLALAEGTPGPLILVNVYAGFFAGWPMGGGSGVLTASLACFYTFAPSFAMILAAAPYVETMQRLRWIRAALAGVSAAVVGVVLNLAVYLGEAALFPTSDWRDPHVIKLGLLVLFAGLALWRDISMTVLIGIGAITGLGLGLSGVL